MENREKSLVIWVNSHNTLIKQYTPSNKKRFANEYAESFSQLAKQCERLATKTSLHSDQRDLTEFLYKEFDMQVQTLEYIAKIFNRLSQRAQDYR